MKKDTEQELAEALGPFVRVAMMLDSMPRDFGAAPFDEVPLRDVLPGAWPTVGDVRRARRAFEAAGFKLR